MKFFIKDMVCLRCKIVVEEVFNNMGLHPLSVQLGEVEVEGLVTAEQNRVLKNALVLVGLQLVEDRRYFLTEKIKTAIIEKLLCQEELLRSKLSDYLSEKLQYDYTYLANQFSAMYGTTIEQYFIFQKIERVKQLLSYDQTTLTEIAWKMQYSSVAHLSAQFKKVTGHTPSQFRQAKQVMPVLCL